MVVDVVGGRYFEDCHEAPIVHDSSGWNEGVAPWALDPGNARRLWETREQLSAAL